MGAAAAAAEAAGCGEQAGGPRAAEDNPVEIPSMRPFVHLASVIVAAGLIVGIPAARVRAEDAPAGPRLFDSPEAAASALIEALKANDDAALEALAGPGSSDLVQSGKDPLVERERKRLAQVATEKLRFEDKGNGSKVLVLGFQDWPAPIPLAPKDGKWFFDAAQGREELLARRIGENELKTIDLMRTLVEAQVAYAAADRDGDGVLEYAQKFVSSPGTKDGLFWIDPPDASLEARSPLGAMVEELSGYAAGTNRDGTFGGYRFKMLLAQGRCAPCGSMSFLVGPNLTRGFAILAVPAEYRLTGVKSFLISHRGRLFERDLGPDGAAVAQSLTAFNPDATWVRVGNP